MRIAFSALLCLGLVAVLTGCQTLRPTRGEEREVRNAKDAHGDAPQVAEVLRPVVIGEETAVIDARPAFEYSMAHIPRAINMQWEEFSDPDAVSPGLLQKDLFAITRRLARAGIGPDTHVVVVGDGPSGTGGDGRIAWVLRYLGVKDVQFLSHEAYHGKLTNVASQPKSVPVWKPQLTESLLVTKQELLKAINKGGTYRSSTQGTSLQPGYAIFDVRSPREYLNKEGLGLRSPVPNMGAMNIEWREFFSGDGRPNPAMAMKLLEVGIRRDQRIIVVSNQGVRSAAVTLALEELGFTNAGNYTGGLTELISGH